MPLIIILYFDWTGSRKDLGEWVDKIKKSCEEEDIEYMGVYGPMNVKWNYAAMFKCDSVDKFRVMARKVPRPSYMPHYINEILFQINI
jgi:hypothetical protein